MTYEPVRYSPHPIISICNNRAEQTKGTQCGRLLCFGHILPHNPPKAGNELRIHRMLMWFQSQGWEVLLAVCTPPHIEPSETDLQAASHSYRNLMVCFHDGTLWHSGDVPNSIAQDLLTNPPVVTSSNLDDSPEWQRGGCPDIFVYLLERLDPQWSPAIHLMQYIIPTRALPRLGKSSIKIIDTMDAFSKFKNQYEPHGFSYTDVSEEQEGVFLSQADIVIAIHDDDERLFARLAPKAATITVGIDFLPPEDVDIAKDAVVLFVAYDNPLNARGLNDFVKFAWPLVRARCPTAKFRIVGLVGKHIENLQEPVDVAGFVEDLSDEYFNAKVVINPVFVGTGLKIKSIEALAHLRPLVAWQAGVDGLNDQLLQFCRVVDDWKQFSDEIVSLLNQERDLAAVRYQRSVVEEVFSSQSVYAPLKDALQHRIEVL